ncbi:FtsW/RodA/SpoVE family cell cycle protein [Flavobacteriales bacterium]|nr:FtsW/RodA/SpoVE family cell cycle protein [Flavobacteriales bacterium]
MSILKNIRGDKAIWIVVIALAIFSFLPVYSASSNFGANLIFSNIIKHISIIFIGIMIMYSTHLVEYKYFKGLSLIILPLVIFLLFFASFQGNVIDGANANRWLNIPILKISFQPSTLASIFLLIYLSNFLSKEKNKSLSFIKTFLLMWLPIILIVALILPSNFSTALLIFIMSTMIIFIAGYKLKHLATLFFLFVLLLSSFLFAVNKFPEIIPNRVDTWTNRIENFVKNDLDDTSNYQINRAKAAIANGKIFGVGAGKSSMKYILPQSTSDFIYSIIAEEYGTIVAFIILLLYIVLLFRIIIISYKSQTKFGQLVSIAVGIPVVFQAFTNMAVAVQLIPVTGQPLPLVSTGGTSIWITFLAMGILLSVSKNNINYNTVELDG